jgi:mono/diheme cytochrome c family protein
MNAKPLLIACAATLIAASAGPADAPKPASPAGRAVFVKWCSSCHGPKTDAPGTGALAVKYGGKVPPQLDKRTDLTPEVVKYFVRHGVSVMPAFRKTEITDAQLNDLANYLSTKKK